MLIPYQSSYDPFIRNCIEGYTFKPDKIEFVGPGKWDNVGDKINDKFHENQDCEFLIFHRAPSLLNPGDLEYMIKLIQNEPKALCVGVEPSFLRPGIRPPKMSDNKNYDCCAGVTIWRAKYYFEVIEEAIRMAKSEGSLIELVSYIGYMGNEKGYKNIQATQARIVYYD